MAAFYLLFTDYSSFDFSLKRVYSIFTFDFHVLCRFWILMMMLLLLLLFHSSVSHLNEKLRNWNSKSAKNKNWFFAGIHRLPSVFNRNHRITSGLDCLCHRHWKYIISWLFIYFYCLIACSASKWKIYTCLL